MVIARDGIPFTPTGVCIQISYRFADAEEEEEEEEEEGRLGRRRRVLKAGNRGGGGTPAGRRV